MASTAAVGFDNLSAKEEQANNVTAFNATTGTAISTVFAKSTVSTTATGGSASALPTDPTGYVEVLIAGNRCKIPFYDA